MTAGRVLDHRYLIEQPLGSGGMGAVWRGRDLRLDRAVAVKELTSAGLALPMAIQRFDREARAVARLAHPNIVAVHDVGTDGGHPYLVMELVEGSSVAAMLDDGPLPVATAVAIAAQACDGLAAAHAAGVIHRDVKPANLLLTSTGMVKICDFGIARLHDSTGDTNLTGSIPALGSCRYMAPEQITGGPVDARTDLYGLGCTLYAMLAGTPPFAGDLQTIVRQHQTRSPAPLSASGADVPPALETLVQQLLRKDPAERPGHAIEVRTRLLFLVRDLAAARVPASPVPLTAVPGAAAVGPVFRQHDEAAPPVAAASDSSPTVIDSSAGAPATRRRLVPLVVVVLMLATALVGTFATRWFTAPDRSAADVRPAWAGVPSSPTTSPSGGVVVRAAPDPTTVTVTVTVTPSRASTSKRSLAPSSPPTPVDPIAAMRLAIKTQVDAGHLNPTKAPDLYKKVDDIAHAINAGDTGDAKRKVGELRDKLAELRTNGTLTANGYDTLITKVGGIAASLP